MLSLIIIFLVGYTIYLGFSYKLLYTNYLVSLLFFLSAFFIMLVLQVNHSLIIRLTMKTLELKEFSEKLLKETQTLSSSKQQLEKIRAMLEEKNKELKLTLTKLYHMSKPFLTKMRETEQKKALEKETPETNEKTPEKTDETYKE